jgi:hypothetical protein
LTEIAERTRADIDLASASLKDVESYIAPRLRGFIEVGFALIAVRERRLYLQAGFDSFELYCRERWQLEDRHARHMVDAAQVAHITDRATEGTDVPLVANEAQARELAPLLGRPDELGEVWRKVAERAAESGSRITAPLIRQARREFEQHRQPSPRPGPAPAPAPQPRPAPVQVVPVNARKAFLILTQAAEEVRALGGIDVFHGEMSAEVRVAWAAELAQVAGFIGELTEACAGRM